MKKIIALLLIFVLLCCVASCSKPCEHEWASGKCLNCDEKCYNHNWIPATCKEPRHCSVCNITYGEKSLEHNCVDDKCQDCGLIILTLDNFEKYIEYDATVKVGNTTSGIGKYDTIYTSAECEFEASGNSHYKYNDVKITIEFYHYDSLADMLGGEAYDTGTITVCLNLAGNGDGRCWVYPNWSKKDFKNEYVNSTTALLNRTTYYITGVEGTIEEY